MLAAIIEPHFEDLTLPCRLADMKAVDDEPISDLGLHLDLLRSFQPDGALCGVLREGPGVTCAWDRWLPPKWQREIVRAVLAPGIRTAVVAIPSGNGKSTLAAALGLWAPVDGREGSYWVVEITAPPGHDLPTPAFQAVTVVADETVTVTFVDPRQRGAIVITKTRKHAADGPGDHRHAGVTFTVNGETVVTDANGQACVDNLLFGSYAVAETVPNGYAAAGPTSQNVFVDRGMGAPRLRHTRPCLARTTLTLHKWERVLRSSRRTS